MPGGSNPEISESKQGVVVKDKVDVGSQVVFPLPRYRKGRQMHGSRAFLFLSVPFRDILDI